MKSYSYQITKYGYKIFCDGVCVEWAEADHKSGKRYSRRNEIDFIRAAQAKINYFQVMDRYNMEVKK